MVSSLYKSLLLMSSQGQMQKKRRGERTREKTCAGKTQQERVDVLKIRTMWWGTRRGKRVVEGEEDRSNITASVGEHTVSTEMM